MQRSAPLVAVMLMITPAMASEIGLRGEIIAQPESTMYSFARGSIEIDGDTMLIYSGGDSGDLGPLHEGRLEVFQRDGSGWSHLQTLQRDDLGERAYFGKLAELEGGDLLVVAPGQQTPDRHKGEAYLYEKQADGTFSHAVTLEFPGLTSSARVGDGALLLGDTAAVDVFVVDHPVYEDGLITYFFERGPDGWQQAYVIPPPQGQDHSQRLESFDGSTVVFGAPGAGAGGVLDKEGAVYIYERADDGSLVRSQALAAPPETIGFGRSALLLADSLFVSGRGDGAFGAGEVYRYTRDGSGLWAFAETLDTPGISDNFGRELDGEGDTLLVRDADSVHYFSRSEGGWSFQARYMPMDGSWHLADHGLGLDGSTVAVSDYSPYSSDTSSFVRMFDLADLAPAAGFLPSDLEVYTHDAVQFTDASVDGDGSVVGWEWNFGDVYSTVVQSYERDPSHAYEDDGEYVVSLWAIDDDGLGGRHQVTITVLNRPPVADFTAEKVTGLEHRYQFQDASSDPDGDVVAWYWDFGDGANSNEQHPEHAYEACGTYDVTLTVLDDDGDATTATGRVAPATVQVSGAPEGLPCLV